MRWTQTEAERFDAKVAAPNDAGCWLWTGCRNVKGYGSFNIANMPQVAHRVRWAREHGPIPAGLMVLHRCDVRSCVNPGHLFLGTAADNTRDMIRKGRAPGVAATRHCGEQHAMAKLTMAQVREIRELRNFGADMGAVAERFGVTRAHANRIARGIGWRHSAA